MAQVYAPAQLNDLNVLNSLEELEKSKDESELIIDYSKVSFARPFGLLLFAEEVRRIVKYRKQVGLSTQVKGHKASDGAHSYLAHVGFFCHQGLEYGNDPGAAFGSSTYLPIEHISKESLESSYGNERSLQDMIVEESLRLSQVILGHQLADGNHPVPYSFREVIRNTFEHGETDRCFICAQKYSGKEIEIAIIDRGIGLKSSLEKKYEVSTHRDALKLAIQPGVTKADITDDVDDYWANSGYGLFVLSELAQRTGNFILCSGSSAMKYEGGEQKFADIPFEGVAIKLLIVKQPGVDLVDMRNTIVSLGEEMTNGAVRASKASKGYHF